MAVIDMSEIFQMTNVGAHIDATDVYNSNPNLLDNAWFTDGAVVNQRGVTSGDYATGVYRMDRWYTSYGANTTGRWELSNQGLTMDLVGYSNSRGWFVQNLDNPSRLVGKTVTGSIMMSDGTIYSGTGVVSSSPTTLTYFCIYPDFQIYYSTQYGFNIVCNKDYTITVKAVKLELGPYSTLANDVPPDWDMTLEKCLWKFERIKVGGLVSAIGFGFADTTNKLYALVKCHPKAKSVTVTLTGQLYCGRGALLEIPVVLEGVYVQIPNSGLLTLQVSPPNNQFVANQIYRFGLGSNAYIDISADI